MKIDAHQHYWDIKRGDYGWITPENTTLYRDFLPHDLIPHLEKHNITGTILVQAAATIAESKFILELAEQEPTILGVVGWLDLFTDQIESQLALLRSYNKFVGVRIMLQDMEDCSVVLNPEVLDRIKLLIEQDIAIDLLCVAHQLDTVIQLLEHFPTMRGVIDHIGKPSIATRDIERWSEQISQISSYKTIYCKLSGMVTEADHQAWGYDQFAPYITHVLECFGPERVMYGSDWPVSLLAATYDQVMLVLQKALPNSWGENEHNQLFGLNAAAFYRLNV